jgi:ERCC4-type nuclease
MPKNARAPKYTVIRDTREQEGYYFSEYDLCLGMIDQKLDTGDYSIVGLEDKICVERKGCVEELAINLGQKKHTFLREIERMKDFPHKFIILEFSLSELIDFPENSRIPEKSKSSVKITGKYLLKCLMEFQLYDNINVIFCDNKYNAFLTVSSLLKRVNELYTVGRRK